MACAEVVEHCGTVPLPAPLPNPKPPAVTNPFFEPERIRPQKVVAFPNHKVARRKR